MGLPSLTLGGLVELNASNLPPSQLFEVLSKYEAEAVLLAAGSGSPEPSGTHSELLSLFYSSFFFSHLLTQQKSEARALTHRLPQILQQQDPSIKSCIALLRALWQTDHVQVFQLLRTASWPEGLHPLVQRYERKISLQSLRHHTSVTELTRWIGFFQDQSLIAVSRSYEAIRPEVAASYLGLDQAAAAQNDPSIIQKFTECGWRWDLESRLLHPAPINVPSSADKGSTNVFRDTMAMLGNQGH
ncbi:COP9 signalosome complex subunit 8 [Penicillium chermesinum]|nr:COP9 signalosome complex subunit 8 [Penicillium chermesinum]